MPGKVIGILGGMGPEATADLFLKIIKATPAARDQEHLRILVDNNPAIPDRGAFIMGQGPDPAPLMCRTARGLEKMGAGLIVIPCNTAHYFHDAVARSVNIPVLHIMGEAAAWARRDWPAVRKVGVLASGSTVKLGLYARALEEVGLTALAPDEARQRLVDAAIYPPDGVKAGKYEQPRAWLAEAGAHLVGRGAELLVMGCTEIPIVLGQEDAAVPLLDATLGLARAAVREALA